jgi:hypothetical protein
MAMKKAYFDASRANPIQLKNNNDGQYDRNFVVLGSTHHTHRCVERYQSLTQLQSATLFCPRTETKSETMANMIALSNRDGAR